ncbi:MAG: DUF4380 domain-containing protein [Bacteroidaceae bacterium]|nr:DUF4380 domain-containing protein [Bacteroidaceae bacterium]
MKRILSVAAVALVCAFCSMNNASAKKSDIQKNDDGIYTLTLGDATLTVNPNIGSKVISLKLGDKEVIAQHSTAGRFPNMNDYGATFWPSPQSNWNWPPIATYDSKPYTVVDDSKSLVCVSGLDGRYPYRFTKEFKTDQKRGCFEITYSIKNESDANVSVAPWEISRVPGAGLIAIGADKEYIHPLDVMPFQFSDGVAWIPFEPSPKQRKAFFNGTGWLAFINNGILFLKTFPDVEFGLTAPEQEEEEVYINENTTFIELENQGEYVLLTPGASLDWTVRWSVTNVSADKPGKELKAEIDKQLKKQK